MLPHPFPHRCWRKVSFRKTSVPKHSLSGMSRDSRRLLNTRGRRDSRGISGGIEGLFPGIFSGIQGLNGGILSGIQGLLQRQARMVLLPSFLRVQMVYMTFVLLRVRRYSSRCFLGFQVVFRASCTDRPEWYCCSLSGKASDCLWEKVG